MFKARTRHYSARFRRFRHTQDPSDSGILAVVGLDGYLQRPNTCPDRAVPPDDEELSHTHTLVRVKNTTRIVPTVVTSRVHCAMGKNFSFSSRLRSIYYLWSNCSEMLVCLFPPFFKKNIGRNRFACLPFH